MNWQVGRKQFPGTFSDPIRQVTRPQPHPSSRRTTSQEGSREARTIAVERIANLWSVGAWNAAFVDTRSVAHEGCPSSSSQFSPAREEFADNPRGLAPQSPFDFLERRQSSCPQCRIRHFTRTQLHARIERDVGEILDGP